MRVKTEEADMMGKKKLSEIKAQLGIGAVTLPRKDSKVEPAKDHSKRIVETLEALCGELERAAKKVKKSKTRRPAKR
jgi:hypothetical protein